MYNCVPIKCHQEVINIQTVYKGILNNYNELKFQRSSGNKIGLKSSSSKPVSNLGTENLILKEKMNILIEKIEKIT